MCPQVTLWFRCILSVLDAVVYFGGQQRREDSVRLFVGNRDVTCCRKSSAVERARAAEAVGVCKAGADRRGER